MFAAKYVHTNLIATDWRELVDFYVRVFGCKLLSPERDLCGPALDAGTGLNLARLRGAHLRLPGWGEEGPSLEIFNYEKLETSLESAVNRPGFVHIAFQVEDVAVARQMVLEAGGRAIGQVVTTQVDESSQVTWCYVTDPEGNIIELQAWG